MTDTITCTHCGATDTPARWSCAAEMIDKQLCFNCLYWQEITEDSDRLIIEGQCYSIGPETSRYKGFGGFTWTIKLADGQIVQTTNLWHRGEVPASWRDALPDNAEFVKIGV